MVVLGNYPPYMGESKERFLEKSYLVFPSYGPLSTVFRELSTFQGFESIKIWDSTTPDMGGMRTMMEGASK